MGYAVFAQRKLTLTSRLNALQLLEMQRDDEQFKLASDTTDLQRRLSSIQMAKSNELSAQYAVLTEAGNTQGGASTDSINTINNQIAAINNKYLGQEQAIQQQIYAVSAQENIIEMEKKRLETQISKIEKELEAIEKSESSAIDRATPKYDGVG